MKNLGIEIEVLRRTTARRYKLLSAGLGLVYAGYSISIGSLGNTFFATSISVLIALSEVAVAPSEIAAKIRQLFQYGDRLARALVIAIGVGGTALTLDLSYGLDIMPDWLDVWLKRFGPALVFVAFLGSAATFLSKRIFYLSAIESDRLIRTYELPFYFFVALACSLVLMLFSGLPVEKFIPTNQPSPTTAFTWGFEWLRFLGMSIVVSLIWVSVFATCVISRYIEYAWRIREEPGTTGAVRVQNDPTKRKRDEEDDALYPTDEKKGSSNKDSSNNENDTEAVQDGVIGHNKQPDDKRKAEKSYTYLFYAAGIGILLIIFGFLHTSFLSRNEIELSSKEIQLSEQLKAARVQIGELTSNIDTAEAGKVEASVSSLLYRTISEVADERKSSVPELLALLDNPVVDHRRILDFYMAHLELIRKAGNDDGVFLATLVMSKLDSEVLRGSRNGIKEFYQQVYGQPDWERTSEYYEVIAEKAKIALKKR